MQIQVADVIMPGNENAFTTGQRWHISGLAELPELHRSLLEKPVTAALATIKPSGLPHLTPVWVSHDGKHVLLNTKKGRLKERNMRGRPKVSLLRVNPQNPYHWITINGTVEEVIEETDSAKGGQATTHIDDMAERYLGKRPYPLRDPRGEVRVLFKVRPDYIMTFGPPPGS